MAETKKKAGRKPKAKAEAPVEAETANLEETVTEGTEEVTAEATLSAEAPEEAPVQDAQKSELDELKALVRQLQDELAARKPQVVQVMADTERVVMRWQAEVADDNLAVFGPGGMYGEITGKTGTITVPKSEWSRFYNESVRGMIARRWLIVLSGMDQQEREVYGCDYKPGELLDEKAFHKLLDLGRDLIAIFPALCREHQAMVASRFLSAYLAGDRRAMDRDLIVALNELSKQSAGNDRSDLAKRGLFFPIIEGLNERDAQ
jgi:hypothetical protein